MRDLDLDLAADGGIHRSRSLIALGHSRRSLAFAIAEQRAHRVRVGWIAHPRANAAGVRAVQLGGRLTGAAALRSLGVWVDSERGPLVACAPHAARLQPPGAGERRVWRLDRFPDAMGPEWRVSVLDALRDFALDASPADLVASVDSALHHGLVGAEEVAALATSLPARHRLLPNRVDAKAESGAESHLRLLLRSRGLAAHPQAELPGIGRVDFLVDGWLIIEVDSRAHHGSPSEQDRDRQRDGNATLQGYATLRFMAMDVAARPDWCLAVVAARLRSGRPLAAVWGAGAEMRRARR